MTQEKTRTNGHKLENLIESAIKKVKGAKENDICRYIPIGSGGYIHHFTMRKMKYEDPQQLTDMIQTHIINVDKPSTVPPKQRAARGSRKRRDQFLFTKEDIERMLNMARLAGDKEMIRKLTPRKDLKQLKRELISSIRHNNINHELWNFFIETIATNETIAAHAASIRGEN